MSAVPPPPYSAGPATISPPPIAQEAVPDAPPARGEWQQVTGRDVAALLDPRPTLVVGSIGRRKEVGLATIIWATPISHEPSMVAFSLRARSHTMSCIQKSRAFSLNVLPASAEGVEVCEQCGTRTGFQFNKITVVKHHLEELEYEDVRTVEVEIPSEDPEGESEWEEAEQAFTAKVKVPVVDCATSWLGCKVESIQETGDHLLVVGTVLQAHTCAPRGTTGLLEPEDVLQCVQHGSYARTKALDL